jgi:hypothetical protein
MVTFLIATQKFKAQESDSDIMIEPNRNVRGNWLQQYKQTPHTAEPENSPVRMSTKSPVKSPYKSPNRARYHDTPSKNIEESSSQSEQSPTPQKARAVVVIDDSPIRESPYSATNDFIVKEKQKLFNETKPSYYDQVRINILSVIA